MTRGRTPRTTPPPAPGRHAPAGRQADAQLRDFARLVCHDLHAPLRSIRGFAQLLAARHGEELSEPGRRCAANIVGASARMAELLDGLLRYASLGAAGVKRQLVSLDVPLRRALRAVEDRVADSGATVDVPRRMPALRTDEDLLATALEGLLANALEYREPGGQPQVGVTCREEPEHVVLEVRDDGIGIPAQHREKVFQAFQRLHTQEEHPGTGLGLAVVRRAAELLGGEVWIRSAPHRGCTACLRLPRQAPEPQG
ncbi:MAG: sensor histidine kinase [Candidatus Brocadiia bacterium]